MSEERLLTDRATYYFRTQVFEAIGTTMVGSNLQLIGGI